MKSLRFERSFLSHELLHPLGWMFALLSNSKKKTSSENFALLLDKFSDSLDQAAGCCRLNMSFLEASENYWESKRDGKNSFVSLRTEMSSWSKTCCRLSLIEFHSWNLTRLSFLWCSCVMESLASFARIAHRNWVERKRESQNLFAKFPLIHELKWWSLLPTRERVDFAISLRILHFWYFTSSFCLTCI